MYRFVFVVPFLLAGAIMDVRNRKIDNRLVLSGILLAFVMRITAGGCTEMMQFFTDLILPVLVLFLLFSAHILGAGDIKLISMVSCFTGICPAALILWLSFLMTALYGVVSVAFGGKKIEKGKGYTKIPFAVPVFISCLCLMVFE